MKSQVSKKVNVTSGKIISIIILYSLSIAISLSGAFFAVYSILINLNIKVLNTHVPGFVFGLIVLYLGIRYLLLVNKLKKDVYKSKGFVWENLKPSNFFAKKK